MVQEKVISPSDTDSSIQEIPYEVLSKDPVYRAMAVLELLSQVRNTLSFKPENSEGVIWNYNGLVMLSAKEIKRRVFDAWKIELTEEEINHFLRCAKDWSGVGVLTLNQNETIYRYYHLTI